jgi:hypothetical protein
MAWHLNPMHPSTVNEVVAQGSQRAAIVSTAAAGATNVLLHRRTPIMESGSDADAPLSKCAGLLKIEACHAAYRYWGSLRTAVRTTDAPPVRPCASAITRQQSRPHSRTRSFTPFAGADLRPPSIHRQDSHCSDAQPSWARQWRLMTNAWLWSHCAFCKSSGFQVMRLGRRR